MNSTEYKEVNTKKRGHLLLPKELKAKLPALNATDGDNQARAIIKFFSPFMGWTWYAFEYDPEDNLFFGFVEGFEKEWGYFSLEELDTTMAMRGLVPAVERDCFIDADRLPTKESLGLR